MLVVIGYRSYSFTEQKSGKVIEGVSFYLGESIPVEKGKGYAINKKINSVSVSNEKLDSVLNGLKPIELVGKTVDPLFNSYERIESLRIYEPKK